MKKNAVLALCIGMIATLMFGCAGQQVMSPHAFSPQKVQASAYELRAPNYLVIMDASSSMGEWYDGHRKFDLAKGVVDRMNQTLPDLAMTGGLRTFGHGYCISKEETVLLSGMGPHSQKALADGLEKAVCAGGNSPLATALTAALDDLKPTQGSVAVIVVSDGKDMASTTVQAAEALKAEFGDRVCLYPVLVGDDMGGQALMDRIAEVGGCGFAVNADSILAPAAMADYVTKVFIGKALDSDGDGVVDALDKCPGTPAGVKVDADGCPLDSDNDGVYDYLDKCPGTPAGVKVDAKGCPLDSDGDGVWDYMDKCPGTPAGAKVNQEGCWVLGGVFFDTDKANIKASAEPELNGIVDVMRQNPDLRVEVQGHTDHVGTAAYNQKLSERRANTVMQYLIDKGIGADRLTAVGYGENYPMADNKTKEGRAKNRRVQLKPIE